MELVLKLHIHTRPLCLSIGFSLSIAWGNLNTTIVTACVLVMVAILSMHYLSKFSLSLQSGVVRLIVAWVGFGLLLSLLPMYLLAKNVQSESLGMSIDRVHIVNGILIGDALHDRNGRRMTIQLESVIDQHGLRTLANGRMRVVVEGTSDLRAGTRISAEIRSIREETEREWRYSSRARLLSETPPEHFALIRNQILARLDVGFSVLPEGLRGFTLALLLGRQDELDPDMQAAFYKSGCAHLVALSGMHIALVAALLVRLIKPLAGVIIARLAGIAGAALFIWIAGPFPSALRALAMFVMLQIGALAGFRVSGIAALCLSGPVLACIDPRIPVSLGYQLSFWALLGIMLFQTDIRKWCVRPLRAVLAIEIGTSLAAQILTIPVLLTHGLAFCPQGIIAGIVLAPLVLIFMACGFLALIAGLFSIQPLVLVLGWGMTPLYQLILQIGSLFSGMGFS